MIISLVKKVGLVGVFIFLGFFFYFYKSSGKFRQSIVAAFTALTIYFSFLPPAHSVDSADAYAFSQGNHHHQQGRLEKRQGIFGQKPDGSGPGKPGNSGSNSGGDGLPEFPQTESVEKTRERVDNIDRRTEEMEKQSDTESETENECLMDQENKGSFKELPDVENFSYDMNQGRGLKKKAEKVWNDKEARQEVIRMLERFDDENASIQEKTLIGFKSLTELKGSRSGPRIIVYRARNEKPTVVGFCTREDLFATVDKLKGKFK